jgi:hypothetical protein
MIPKLVQLENKEENCQLAISNQSLNIKVGIKVLDMFRQTIPVLFHRCMNELIKAILQILRKHAIIIKVWAGSMESFSLSKFSKTSVQMQPLEVKALYNSGP